MPVTVLRRVAILAVSAVLTGCGAGPWAVSAGQSPLAASPSQSGAIYSGAENCAYDTADGDYTVYVLMQNVSDCGTPAQALASFGKFWSPFAYSTAAGYRLNGALPNADRYCVLDGNGSMILSVYEASGVEEPIGSGLAGQVCQAEEQNGWTPEARQ